MGCSSLCFFSPASSRVFWRVFNFHSLSSSFPISSHGSLLCSYVLLILLDCLSSCCFFHPSSTFFTQLPIILSQMWWQTANFESISDLWVTHFPIFKLLVMSHKFLWDSDSRRSFVSSWEESWKGNCIWGLCVRSWTESTKEKRFGFF